MTFRSLLAAVAALVAPLFVHAQPPAPTSPAMPPSIAAAVDDPGRPAGDRARDPMRHPAEVVAFSGVKPGDTVVELIPGAGYFTRVLAKAVAPGGKVFAVVPTFLAQKFPKSVEAVNALAADPTYSGAVKVVVEPLGRLSDQGPADLVWTAQNYHDLHNPALPATTALSVDRAVFATLKPGGVFLVEDHRAEQGSGVRDAGTLHRIDPDVVRDECRQAGFVLEAESPVVANVVDPHTANVFDPSIRGRTDQFVMKFRKPG